MKRCVIVGGAEIKRYDISKSYLREDDYMIYCDCGLRHREGLGREADLIIGDFDSYDHPHSDTETIVLPIVKDDTDTVYAMKVALSRGFDDFLLLGVFGGRFDQTLSNLSILFKLFKLGKTALAVDDFGETSIAGSEWTCIEDKYRFFSLLAYGGDAGEVYIENAKYPLQGADISVQYSIGVSNEVLSGKTARVRAGRGQIVLIKIFR